MLNYQRVSKTELFHVSNIEKRFDFGVPWKKAPQNGGFHVYVCVQSLKS